MKFLLDTHTFIWWDGDPGKLSASALAVLQDQTSILLLSVVSVWEMQIKSQLGRLNLTLPLADLIADQRQRNQIELLSVNLEHVLALDQLPLHHKDQFDRLLIAQANVENATLISADTIFPQYPVKLLW